jgi:putative phosphoesterase
MRIAIVSDIHGNRTAFQAVLADLRQTSPDLIVQGGDLAQGGSHPAEIIDQIRLLGWPGVYGNTDEVLWTMDGLHELFSKQPKLGSLLKVIEDQATTASAWIGVDRIEWLKSLPLRYSHDSVTVVHAGPDNVWRSPMHDAADADLEKVYGPLNSKIVVYGHIHRPFIRMLQGFTVANSGSVSLSYDGDTRASYLLIDGEKVTIRRVEYDLDKAVQDLMSSALPHAEWVCRVLWAGKYCPPKA